jgi:uncharacterized protein YjbK
MTSSNQNPIPFEKELKLNLENKSNHQKILDFFGYIDRDVFQLNIFYDSDHFLLRKNKLALRLRKETNKYTLTAKGSNISSNEVVTRPEIECALSRQIALSILEKKRNLAELTNSKPVRWIEKQLNVPVPSLHEVVRFENLRQLIKVPIENQLLLFELDTTYYDDRAIHYELEIEFPKKNDYESCRLFIEKILKKASIPWKISGLSKYERALQMLEKQSDKI